MNPSHHPTVGDDELVLFHYGDGLDPARRSEIARQLGVDGALSRRLAQLRIVLATADLDRPPEPDAATLARIADGVAGRIASTSAETRAEPTWDDDSATAAAAGVTRPLGGAASWRSMRPARASRRRAVLGWVGGALAASLLLALGFFAGRESASPPTLAPAPATLADAAVVRGDRVYAATLVSHLGATRRALLTAANGEGETLREGNAELARALLDDHRLYLAAAQLRGDARLAELLREIEPVLIELANPALGDDIQASKGLADFLEDEDLIFQVRAAEAGLAARTTTSI